MPLLTLTGPGGVGKTRLALAAATNVAPRFSDGAMWIDLAPLGDSSAYPSTLLAAIGIDSEPVESIRETIVRQLRAQQVLLVLDNCEHLAAGVADLLEPVLMRCPRVQVLATSRAPLFLRAERLFPLHPLPLPDDDAPLAALVQNEAVRLFVERMRAVRPEFVLDAESTRSVTELCRRLDGLPLAIELAAVRGRILSPGDLLAHVRNNLPQLRTHHRDAPARQQTLGATIAWSYGLLSSEDRERFCQLAVFVGGWTTDAAAAIGTDSREAEIDGLARLVDQSLVQIVPPTEEGGGTRFAMLETIREFGLRQLQSSGNAGVVRRRHAENFLALVEDRNPSSPFMGDGRWLAAVAQEQHNCRLALAWFAEANESELLLRMAGSLFEFWFAQNHYREGRDWLERALDRGRDAAPGLRVWPLIAASSMALYQNDVERASALAGEGLSLAHEVGTLFEVGGAMINAGLVAQRRGEIGLAKAHNEEALAWYRDHEGTLPSAAAQATSPMTNLGALALSEGNLEEAERWFVDVVPRARAHGYAMDLGEALTGLGEIAVKRGDVSGAARRFEESLDVQLGRGDMEGVAMALIGVARVAFAIGQLHRSARIFGVAEAIGNRLGTPTYPTSELAERQRAMLGESAWRAERDAGATLHVIEAVADARRVIADAAAFEEWQATSGARDPAQLTQREREVLRLLAQGRTNTDIGAALYISRRTASTHVANIYAKLGVSSRIEARNRAHRDGLL